MICRACSGTHAVTKIKISKESATNIKKNDVNSTKPSERKVAFSMGINEEEDERFLIITESPLKNGTNYLVDFIMGDTKKDKHVNIFAEYNNEKFNNTEKNLAGGSYQVLMEQNRVR